MLKTVGILALCFFAFAWADERVPSACEEDRARRLNGTVTQAILHLVPECEANGDYAAKQCFTDNDWCVCYRRNGDNINTPSKNIKACECIRDRDDALTAGDTYRPVCNRDGTYHKRQCEFDECWCVDADGNILTEPQLGQEC